MSATDLHRITDEALATALASLVRHERAVTIDVLHHLNEVERRKLHLKLGFSSLFSYCTMRLGYSESAAGRRIQTARFIRRFPQVVTLLERGEVNLSTVCKVAGTALSENAPELVERIRGKTQDEVSAIVAEYRPAVRLRDRVQPVRTVTKAPAAAAAGRILLGAKAPTKPETSMRAAGDVLPPNHSRSGSAGESSGTPQRRHDEQPVEQKFRVQFVAGTELMLALERAKSLLSFRLPADAPMESVLAVVLDEFIDRHDPQRRRERRKRSRACKSGDGSAPNQRRDTRRVATTVRDDVFERDGRRCTYVGRDGTRCGATHHLQIDHIRPLALGGRSDPHNLRVLCGPHNRLEAERLLGAATMSRHTARRSLPLPE